MQVAAGRNKDNAETQRAPRSAEELVARVEARAVWHLNPAIWKAIAATGWWRKRVDRAGESGLVLDGRYFREL